MQKTFNAIVEALVEEGGIELNLRVFEVKRHVRRKARNPRTGDRFFVPESTSSRSSRAKKWKNASGSWNARRSPGEGGGRRRWPSCRKIWCHNELRTFARRRLQPVRDGRGKPSC